MKISIAMCTYNGAPFLREQLDSLLAQGRLADEVVVCDDASNDETIEIIEDFARTAPFEVKLSINQTNLGPIKNFENAIRTCSGDLICLCDQDDVWRADKIESIERAFDSDSGVGLVMSDAELVDGDLASIDNRLFAELGFTPRMRKLAASGKRFDLFLKRNYFCGATMAFRADFKNLILPFPEHGPLIHDGWIGLLVSAVGKVSFDKRPLISYRLHGKQQMGLPRISTSAQIVRAETTDREFYRTHAQQLSEALARAVAWGIDARSKELLRQKIAHLKQRAELPSSPLRRLGSITREVINLHYHRFSRGWFSAAKDLLA